MKLSVSAAACLSTLLLAAVPGAAALGMYTKKSPVMQVDAKSWDKLIVNSHLPSVVEFYAPWCGHCQNLKPAYEKAASSLTGIVQIAAVDCDDDSNKGLCGQLGIQGFPAIKTVRPASLIGTSKPSKKGRPAIADYRGERSARGIADAAKFLLPNLVARVTDAEIDEWTKSDGEEPKALLFSDKGTTSALLKSLALDFKGTMAVGQVRGDREDRATEMFDVVTFPTLLVLPGQGKPAERYAGDMNKADMLAFLSKFAEPVPGAKGGDPASSKKNSNSKSKKEKAPKASSSKKKASPSAPPAASETLVVEEDDTFESPGPIPDSQTVHRVAPDPPAPLQTLATPEELGAKCLGAKTGTCILALLPPASITAGSDDVNTDLAPKAAEVLASLTELNAKLHAGNAYAFPIYAVTPNAAVALRRSLGLEGDEDSRPHLLAVNGKRAWFRRHDGGDAETGFTVRGLEAWLDGVKLGDVKKEKLPEDLIVAEETGDDGRKDEL